MRKALNLLSDMLVAKGDDEYEIAGMIMKMTKEDAGSSQ